MPTSRVHCGTGSLPHSKSRRLVLRQAHVDLQVNAVASPHEIVMLESFPPQISIPGVTSGQLLFTASAGTFADGPQTGCSGARAWAYAGNTVSFNVPADVESYTIHVAHASGHGEVSIAEYVVGSPGAGGCAEDLDSDGLVNVNDLLGILSFFGSDGADGGDVDGNGVVDVNDLLQLLSAFGAECSGGGAGAAAAPCSYGEDCGGQQFTECGTMCPAECGSLPGIMCNMMCYNGFQCPNGQVTAAPMYCSRDPIDA